MENTKYLGKARATQEQQQGPAYQDLPTSTFSSALEHFTSKEDFLFNQLVTLFLKIWVTKPYMGNDFSSLYTSKTTRNSTQVFCFV